jgi:hypothetical protein
MRRGLLAGVGLSLVLVTVGAFWADDVRSRITEVLVTNFPPVQVVAGEVKVIGPIRQTVFVSFKDVTVPPVAPTETTRLINAGTLGTSGLPKVVLSLQGKTAASVLKAGRVGAILVPDEEPIQQALAEKDEIQFPLEVSAAVPVGDKAYFASGQPYLQTGFPQYRVLLWNTTDRTVTVNVYAYLTP